MSQPPGSVNRTGTPVKGVRAGGLELIDRIGVGGVAEVYRGIRRMPGKRPELVVIKKMRGDKVADPFFSERFHAEVDIVQMLRHRNVVGGHEMGSIDGHPYIVMDYVDGKSLEAVLRMLAAQKRHLETSMAVYVVIELLRGLTYVHELTGPTGRPLGVVHRDVAPDNVLLSYTGHVSLTDFGIALLDGIEAGAEEGPVAGKLGYLSPEQAARQALDARSDLFAVGCILYELTVGRGAFSTVGGESEQSVLVRTADAKFVKPSKIVPDYPRDLERIVLMALEKKPKNRFQDGNAFLAALEDLSFVRPNEPEMLGRWLRENFRGDYASMRFELPAV